MTFFLWTTNIVCSLAIACLTLWLGMNAIDRSRKITFIIGATTYLLILFSVHR